MLTECDMEETIIESLSLSFLCPVNLIGLWSRLKVSLGHACFCVSEYVSGNVSVTSRPTLYTLLSCLNSTSPTLFRFEVPQLNYIIQPMEFMSLKFYGLHIAVCATLPDTPSPFV